MTFSESISHCFSKIRLPFEGRASRSEFWWFYLFSLLCFLGFAVVVGGILGAIGFSVSDPANLNSGIMGVGLFVFMIIYIVAIIFFGAIALAQAAAVVRRLHDRNMSGWWYVGFIFLMAIPFVGVIVLIGFIVLLCLKGTSGHNKYGADPLGAGDDSVFS